MASDGAGGRVGGRVHLLEEPPLLIYPPHGAKQGSETPHGLVNERV